MYPVWNGTIENGKVKFHSRKQFDAYTATLEGKEIEIVIRIPRSYRSLPQNKYYWKVVCELISEHTGYSKDEVHSILKGKFATEYKPVAGEDVPVTRSTTELTTIEFSDYLSQIRTWASRDLDIFIPNVGEVDIQ